MKRAEIEKQANTLLRQMGVFCADDPLECLAPQHAVNTLGYDYALVESLNWPPGKGATVWGGQIDRQARCVSVARGFRAEVQRFTAAHEVGHIILHGDYETVRFHRDIPLSGAERSRLRPTIEREADAFAGFYLMPRTLLHKHLELRFGVPSLANIDWSDALAFHLSPGGHHRLLADGKDGRRARSLAIATATSLSGSHFQSMADVFHVSPIAMAIQLELIGAVR